MLDPRYLRQQDAVDMDKLSALPITLIGAGAIGSTTAVWLGKMGVRDLTIWDNDEIQDHNWSNQLYREVDIGRPKAEAIWDMVDDLCSFQPGTILQRYDGRPLSGIVISAVDSMISRKDIWKSVRTCSEISLYIDARMSLETMIVYVVNPQRREDRLRYSNSLHSDENSLPEPCTARTICYTPLMASSVICNLVKRFINGEDIPKQVVLDLTTFTLISN